MIDYFSAFTKADRVKLDSVDQDQLVAHGVAEWNNWTTAIQDFSERALEARQLYVENRPDFLEYEKPDDAAQSLSRVRRPALAQAIDSTIAQQHQASFPMDERFYKARPRNKLTADRMETYEKHVERRLSLVEFLINSLKDRKNMMLDGTSAVWHPFMRKTERKVNYSFPKFLGISIPVKPSKSYQDAVTLEATGFIPLNFEDWRVDPNSDNFEEAPFIWRRFVPVDALKNTEAFETVDDLVTYEQQWNDESASNKRTQYEDMGIQQTYNKSDCPLAAEMALVYERWGDFYIDGDFYPNHVLVFANDAHFLYFGPNPYDHQLKPFTVSAYTLLPGTLYGKSQAQDIIPLCHALDTLLNQAIDIISRTGNPSFTYLTLDEALTEFFGNGEVSLVPGEGIPVKSHDSIRPIVWDRGAIQEIFAAMQQLKEEIRESTGGVPYTTGGESAEDQQRTLGEVQILASGTNTRFQLNIGTYEEQRLKPYLKMFYENDRQFMTEPVFVDDENEPLTPNVVKMMDLSFDVTGSRSIMTRSKEVQDYDFLLQNYIPKMLETEMAKTNGDIVEFNIPELFKRRLSMSSVKDFDNVMKVIPMQEIPQEAPAMGLGAIDESSAIPGLTGGQAPVALAAA